MVWKRLDDDQVGDNVTWSAIQTQRQITNFVESAIGRTNAATWSWNKLAHDVTDVSPGFITRYVRLGSKRERGFWWQWAPHPWTRQIKIEMLAELVTQPGVRIRWYVTTGASNSLFLLEDSIHGTELGIGVNNTGPVALGVYTWTFDLDVVQGGATEPYQLFFFMQVVSETSTDPGDVLTYNILASPSANRDFRDNNQSGVRYGFRYLDTTDTFLRRIEKYEITNITTSDPLTAGKGGGYTDHWSYTETPFDVILRDDISVVWTPPMSEFPYVSKTNGLEITRIGDLQLESMTFTEILQANEIKGPASSSLGLITSLSGGRSAKGPEHMQVFAAHDQLEYGRVPIHSWGPQISDQSSIQTPVSIGGIADDLTTGACPVVYFDNSFYYTIAEYRVGTDDEFGGDIAQSQRRQIEILPMWLCLQKTEDAFNEYNAGIRIRFTDGTNPTYTALDTNIKFQPYWSHETADVWFARGLNAQLNRGRRTSFSSNAMWPTNAAVQLLRYMYTAPIKFVMPEDVVTDSRYMRIEFIGLDEILTGEVLVVDLGCIIRSQPAWSDDGTTIANTVRNT